MHAIVLYNETKDPQGRHIAWERHCEQAYLAGDLLEEKLAVDVTDGDPEALRVCEYLYAGMNRGSGAELPELDEKRLRSMCIGDVVLVDGRAYVCESMGWREVLEAIVYRDDHGLLRRYLPGYQIETRPGVLIEETA